MSTGTKMDSKRPSDEVEAAHSSGVTGIAHASSHNKRQKMTKSDVLVGEEEEEDVLTSILPLRLAVLGGYLPLKDTGRFLLRVGKDTTASIFEERLTLAVGGKGEAKDATVDREIGDGVRNDGSEAADAEANTSSLSKEEARNEAWKFLCEQKWKNPSTLEHLVSVLGNGEMSEPTVWERLFRKFLPPPPKPPVRASVEDYSFVFTLKNCVVSERDFAIPLTTFVLKGDDAVKFLKTGESGWLELDSPIRLSFKPNWARNMISTLHVLRKSDGKSCELIYQSGLSYSYDEGDIIDYSFKSGSIINVSDFETIVTSRKMIDNRGVSIDRALRVTASNKGTGITGYKYGISHISFTAKLFLANEDDSVEFIEFSDPSNELATGVTVADLLSRLDVEWK